MPTLPVIAPFPVTRRPQKLRMRPKQEEASAACASRSTGEVVWVRATQICLQARWTACRRTGLRSEGCIFYLGMESWIAGGAPSRYAA